MATGRNGTAPKPQGQPRRTCVAKTPGFVKKGPLCMSETPTFHAPAGPRDPATRHSPRSSIPTSPHRRTRNMHSATFLTFLPRFATQAPPQQGQRQVGMAQSQDTQWGPEQGSCLRRQRRQLCRPTKDPERMAPSHSKLNGALQRVNLLQMARQWSVCGAPASQTEHSTVFLTVTPRHRIS